VTVRLPAPGPIAGALPITGALPAGFAHPHASEEARRIAEAGLILRVQVGSGVHGTAIDGQDDRDELGLCLEPPQFVTGLARVPNGVRGEGLSVRFEQYERHTAWDRPGGVANRSGAGDLDVVIYSARKPHSGYLRSIRRGERRLAEVVGAVSETEARLAQLRDSASIADQPDRRWVDDWLHRSYLGFWASSR
jgi:RNA repair pathway DNA polymerase beta family